MLFAKLLLANLFKIFLVHSIIRYRYTNVELRVKKIVVINIGDKYSNKPVSTYRENFTNDFEEPTSLHAWRVLKIMSSIPFSSKIYLIVSELLNYITYYQYMLIIKYKFHSGSVVV